MSRYSHATQKDIWRAHVVAEVRDDVSVTDYLAHCSRADPEEIDA